LRYIKQSRLLSCRSLFKGIYSQHLVAILCVAIFNTFNCIRHAFKAKVFRCFGRIALPTGSLIYLALIAVIPVTCTLSLLLISLDAELMASAISELVLLCGSAWVSNSAMSWLSLGVIVFDRG
jgi:hypothetical protein